MSAALDAQKADLSAKAAQITDDADRLECLRLIDRWAAVSAQVEDLEQKQVDSYSGASGSITRRALEDMLQREQQLIDAIRTHINPGKVIDMRSIRDLRRPFLGGL